ncbi:MAG: methionine--tRNA ligase [Bacteroidales bacterium]|nr:methionine--tRNA ligase [Bacteroidales bacterium]
MMKNYKRHLITAALPYANGPVHIGHLAGVYVPADIYVRYLRLKGEDVIFVCGSDEHGVPITIKAKEEGVSPQKIVDRYHEIIKKAFADFGIAFDIYSRTTSSIHYKLASDFFKKLFDKGEFIEKTTKQYFDIEANQFLADRYITGECPQCGNDSAFGDQCEQCGSSLSPTDLKNPKSAISGTKPMMKDTLHWFLPLNKHEKFLRTWLLEKNKHWKTNVYGQCKSWLDAGLQPRAVSRDLDWGVPVPKEIKGSEGKVLYVWFDAPIGYISATKELTDEWEKYWKQEDTRMVHFIGKDNIVFHCIIFPIMLKAEGSYILPENVPANEFLNLEGDKISTSRNWAVWLHEYLDEFPGKEDVLRYVLCANAPETKDNDFTWKDFQSRNNNELVAILGNFINRTVVLTHKFYNGRVPSKDTVTDYDKKTLAEIPRIKTSVENSLDSFRIRESLKNAMDLARLGNKYLADTEPWNLYKTDPDRVKTILNISLQISTNLATLISPFLPKTSQKIAQFLNINPVTWDLVGSDNLLKSGHIINKTDLLFEKIEDDAIEKQLNKLEKIKKQNTLNIKPVNPQKELIHYEDFSKLDIRIGTVVEAVKVPETQKLMQLTIDTGIDKRIVVAGIAEFFNPEEVVGRQVAILINLEPRKLRGIESQGMILMAEDEDGSLKFIIPDKVTKPGSVIS